MAITTEAIKTCRVCGTEKPISTFQANYHNLCKICRNEQRNNYFVERRLKNTELYGTTHSPLALEKAREHYALKRDENMVLYGTACTPARREADNKGHRQRRIDRKMQALALLGSICACCGEPRTEMLTFDHINGDGNRADRERVLCDILRQESPNISYRILCWNCNMSSGFYGYCPHSNKPPEEEPVHSVYERAKYHRQLGRRHKLEMIDAYGGKCRICGESNWEFLCIDHINGGGKQHRKELGLYRGYAFYKWLKKQGYPVQDYQLLCFNCNGAKGLVEDRQR